MASQPHHMTTPTQPAQVCICPSLYEKHPCTKKPMVGVQELEVNISCGEYLMAIFYMRSTGPLMELPPACLMPNLKKLH